jgi:Family of unknown function (DUF5682)
VSAVSIFGVRHHGPGSARAVSAALGQVRPDLVLIEGAPELTAVAHLAASADMIPPVAGLVYAPNAPQHATFYPMAVFSPEWVALRWALDAGVDVRFADLPAATRLTAEAATPPTTATADPVASLAAAAGFDDPERWWEDAIEHRYHGAEAFDAIRDAMAALRGDEAFASWGGGDNDRREAAMRQAVRTARREGRERVAFICGAWHAPALHPDAFPTATHDAALLRGLARIKVAATWVPWTNRRLAFASGYGAGVTSPGWYHHLYAAPGDVTVRWLTRCAALLRDEQLDAPPSGVIDAVRLADALAALRGRPLAGLAELTEATQAVLCGGAAEPLRLVGERLLVGDAVGAVPDDTPMVPLARDLERLQRRLRLKRTAGEQVITLDLRKPTHLERSHLLHRLRLLGVGWGTQIDPGRTRGTFKEAWSLTWEPELSVALIDASSAGTTIAAAAAATVAARVADADIAALTDVVEEALLADLPAALDAAMAALAERSARQHDTQRLMAAVEPLARVSRYGNVRGVDTDAITAVLRGVATRVAIGLGAACSSLDDDAAAQMRGRIDGVQRGLALIDDGELRGAWLDAVAGVADQHGVHGHIVGRAVRLLLDARRIASDEAGRRLSRALSGGAAAAAGASWLDGFLSGDATLLLHDRALLAVVDGWVSRVATTPFDDLLPVLRRTFAAFSAAERRMIGDRVRRLDGSGTIMTPEDPAEHIDPDRARRVVPVLRAILGATT